MYEMNEVLIIVSIVASCLSVSVSNPSSLSFLTPQWETEARWPLPQVLFIIFTGGKKLKYSTLLTLYVQDVNHLNALLIFR